MPADARGLEQHEGAEDVRLDELARRLDRAVDVRLGGEVDDRIAALDGLGDPLDVGDVALDELDLVVGQPLEVLAAARVGQLVEDAERSHRGAPRGACARSRSR